MPIGLLRGKSRKGNFTIELLVIWVLFGICAGVVATSRGRERSCLWFFLGVVLGPIGFALAFAGGRKCPDCASRISREAKVCPKCRARIEPTAKPDPFWEAEEEDKPERRESGLTLLDLKDKK